MLMKKILWTSLFWIIVFAGFILSLPMFDVQMKTRINNWLDTPNITASWEIVSSTIQVDIMSGVNTIQTTLADMQTKLDTLVGTSAIVPVVTPDATPDATVSTGN